MVERFEVGKSYRWIGPKERPNYFCSEGRMDLILDGLPHKCVNAGPEDDHMQAAFEGCENDTWINNMWGFHGHMEDFEEVPVV